MGQTHPSEARNTGLPTLRLAGIYASALRCLAVDLGYPLAALDGSSTVRSRTVWLLDRHDCQGIRLIGELAAVSRLASELGRVIPGTVQVLSPHESTLVFTRVAKRHLDAMRRRTRPTISEHHLLKAHGALGVERLERSLGTEDARGDETGLHLWRRLVRRALQSGTPVRVVHAKPWKRDVVAHGEVERLDDGLLTIRRRFHPGGLYDSLDLPKRPGDWGRIEILDGGTVLRRTYYRSEGELIGELYNVQAPAEVGPDLVWYVDLEVDVVRWPDGTVKVVDLPELDALARSGAVDQALVEMAARTADRLAQVLEQRGDWLAAAREAA